MHVPARLFASVAIAGATLIAAVAPVSAGVAHMETLVVGSRDMLPSAAAILAANPCQDPAHRFLGGKWQNGEYRWAFNAASTPDRLGRNAVEHVLMRSFNNITGARNSCGLPDNVSATHTYLGTTSTKPKCTQRDHKNVVGFKRLQLGVLAVTCYWISSNRIVEADIAFNTRQDWALSMNGCHHQPFLESTATHEAGHAFGLGHVGERRHGRLTMSPFLDGPCNAAEASLGLGDVRGLEALY